MLFEARAKVNLTLEVIGRREDGYHILDTVFQPLSVTDRIWADKLPSGLLFSCTDKTLETEDNLVCRAFRLMKEQFAFEEGLQIRLEKRIPSQAGLGGGSSDAAAILLACNRLFSLGLSRETLAGLGARLGADVPALLYNSATRGSGSGASVRPIKTSLKLPLLLIKPPLGLSTPAMYRRLDEIGPQGQREVSLSQAAQAALEADDAAALKQTLYNAFDAVADEAEIISARQMLLQAGAEKVVLSGSGSASFGVFADAESRDKAFLRLAGTLPEGWWIQAADTVNEES